MTFGVQKREQTCFLGSWCRSYSQGRREGEIQWGSDLVSQAISIIIVNLTQNGLPQLQDLYYLPLLAQCTVRAFVYLEFQFGMNICIKAHKYSPKVSQ